jgi:ABC-type transport system involved in cytochrome bd biosynthesis fused ATPase/permease subunit
MKRLSVQVLLADETRWLMNDSIKNNILFASPYDEARYSAVLLACSLEHDLDVLDYGDDTLIGDRGIILSGGSVRFRGRDSSDSFQTEAANFSRSSLLFYSSPFAS